MGKQSVGLRIATKSEGGNNTISGTISYDLALIRRGDALAIVSTFSFAGSSPPLPDLARKVAGRMAKI